MALKDWELLSKAQLNQAINEASAVLAKRIRKERIEDWADLACKIEHFIEKHGPITVDFGPITWTIDEDAVLRVPTCIQIPTGDENWGF